MSGTFESRCRVLDHSTHCYEIAQAEVRITYVDALRLWQLDEIFRTFFIDLLADSPFEAYRWETPPITKETASDVPFAFVLLDSPGLARNVDSKPFGSRFVGDGEGIVTFENKGKDARLVVPSPRGPDKAYGHLAAFVRSAPAEQIHALWRVVGETTEQRLSANPTWLSTAGAGVSWLHVRLDSRPKYYRYAPYRERT